MYEIGKHWTRRSQKYISGQTRPPHILGAYRPRRWRRSGENAWEGCPHWRICFVLWVSASFVYHTSKLFDCFMRQHQTGQSMSNTPKHGAKVGGALPPVSYSWGGTCLNATPASAAVLTACCCLWVVDIA